MSRYSRYNNARSNRSNQYGFNMGDSGSNKPVFNSTLYFSPPSTMQIRVSNYGRDVMLHCTKGGRYMPVRENEYYDLHASHSQIKKLIKKCKAKISDSNLDPEYEENNFDVVESSAQTKKMMQKKKRKAEKFKKKTKQVSESSTDSDQSDSDPEITQKKKKKSDKTKKSKKKSVEFSSGSEPSDSDIGNNDHDSSEEEPIPDSPLPVTSKKKDKING